MIKFLALAKPLSQKNCKTKLRLNQIRRQIKQKAYYDPVLQISLMCPPNPSVLLFVFSCIASINVLAKYDCIYKYCRYVRCTRQQQPVIVSQQLNASCVITPYIAYGYIYLRLLGLAPSHSLSHLPHNHSICIQSTGDLHLPLLSFYWLSWFNMDYTTWLQRGTWTINWLIKKQTHPKTEMQAYNIRLRHLHSLLWLHLLSSSPTLIIGKEKRETTRQPLNLGTLLLSVWWWCSW